MDLFAHQLVGAAWLLKKRAALLADEQGLGKTATAITALDACDATRVLVVAPSVVAHNWAREIRAWSPTRSVHVLTTGNARVPAGPCVVVTTHDLLRSPLYRRLMAAQGWHVIVVDEAHAFRNRGAARTKRLFGFGQEEGGLVSRALRVWLLTGTPIPNNPTEWWSYLAGIDSGRLAGANGRPMSWHQWRSRYCALAPIPFGDGWKIVGAKNGPELRQRLDGFMLRRLKADHLDLPPVRWGYVELDAAKSPELRAIEAKLPPPGTPDYLRALRDSAEFSTWRRLCGEAKAPAAAALLVDELQSDPSRKIVLFAHHTHVLRVIQSALRAEELASVEITGAVPAAQRQRAVDAFQRDPRVRVALCNIVAGGVGVTLTSSHDVVFVEQSYVPGENAQAADRVHRIGQGSSVLVRVLTLAGSADSHVAEILGRKREMIAQSVRATP